ncbi:hypothetical protein D0Z67_12290 [Streptomyces seoulensis]|uniref:NUDIX hydrolase n=1 Tax=Streptomyces seoulensis TaxID=73044 RepID=A0A4P6TU34_STRSO|nr:hypothetical protein [Streptomyces seoulensis]QBJ91005.1 hypothetical protein D0Z67_12290 [Streptomyces seoulensis]
MHTTHVLPSAVDRRVYLLLLDDENRLMLCGGCCNGWTVPQVLLEPGVDFQEGAVRHLARRFRIENPRFGSVYGIHETSESDCWERGHHTVSRILIVRINAQEAASFRWMSGSHTMWGINQLTSRHQEISPEGVALLVSGYVEGWLPDGPVSFR